VPASPAETVSSNQPLLNFEWSFILAACSSCPLRQKTERLRRLLQDPVRWPNVMELADHHGVEPQVYHSLLDVEDTTPASVMQVFRQSYQNNLHKALLLSRELIEIMGHLASAGVEAMPYKGLALAQLLYGDVAQRQAGDIDLLIRPPRELSRIRKALGPLGYKPHTWLREPEERAYLKSGYELSFDGKAGPNLLEMQWAIHPRFYAIDFDMEAFFARAVTTEVAGCPMKTLNSSDLLLVLCAHAAKHAWGRLLWLCDIAQLVSSQKLDWDWIWAEANRLGIARIVHVTLLLANRMLQVPLPASAQAHLTDSAASQLAQEIQASIANQVSVNVESLSYFRLLLHLRERRADQLKFLSRLIFTPGPSEWSAVRLPRALFPLYRVVRVFRLAARIART